VRRELEVVKEYAHSLGLTLPQIASEQFDRYLGALIDWGSRMNLIGSTNPSAIAIDHFCDAVAVVAATASNVPIGARVVDVGSGAGFPGIPIAILRPDLRVTLIEAQRKRVAFLEHVRSHVACDYEVVWARAEAVALDADHLDRYDAAFERAVAPLASAVGLVLPLVAVGGIAVFMKGPKAYLDADAALTVERILGLGGRIEATHTYTLPGATPKTRTLVFVRKAAPMRA